MNRRGLTLLEVMMAIAIFALAAAMMLPQPRRFLLMTGTARDQRVAWTLAAQKMAEIELDSSNFEGSGGGSSGDFVEEGHPGFFYQWSAERIEVNTVEEGDFESQPKEIFHVKLVIRKGEEQKEGRGLANLEAMFPVEESGEGSDT